MLTRSLWLVSGIHLAWNFAQGPIFGLPVSGIRFPSLLYGEVQGPALWTGGDFGPEAGLVALSICLIPTCAILARVVRRGKLIGPPWARPASTPEM